MNIVFIAHEVHRRGGMERAAAEILERLTQKHKVTIIASECELHSNQFEWEYISAIKRPNLLYQWVFRWKARKAERKRRPHLTISIGAAAVDANVIYAQFCHAAYNQQHSNLRGEGNPLSYVYHKLAPYVFMWQERRAYRSRRLKQVIAVSHGMKKELMHYYNLPSEKIEVIPNGVDPTMFKPAACENAKQSLRRELGLPEKAFVCLFVGGDWNRKGLADAINAVAEVPGSVLAVVGRGDTKRFTQIASDASIQDRVLFFGSSSSPQDYYSASDVFVFPSRYEAFSLVTLEAAASGLPILASRINGTEDLIINGVNGYFVEMNAKSIAEKLILLKNNPDLRRRMSEAIRNTSLRYGWDHITQENLALLEAVASTCDRA